MSTTLPGSLSEERRQSLQRGFSFIGGPQKKEESKGRWRDFVKQLHDKWWKVYDIVYKLHDQRLPEQQGMCVCVCVCLHVLCVLVCVGLYASFAVMCMHSKDGYLYDIIFLV